jgi:HK97 gp10 family phage protein
MNLNFEITNSQSLQNAYREFGLDIGNRFLNAALRRAGKIGVKAVREKAQSVFVGKGLTGGSGTKRRGGATEQDVRAKVVQDGSTVKLLVGVAKGSQKVGWRTHFLELGTAKMTAKPFVFKSVEGVLPQIEADLQNSLDIVIARYRNRL